MSCVWSGMYADGVVDAGWEVGREAKLEKQSGVVDRR